MKRTKYNYEINSFLKGSKIIEILPAIETTKRVRFQCVCGTRFISDKRSISRRKRLECENCVKERNSINIIMATKKRKPKVLPDFRVCSSCGFKGKREEFPPNRNMCKPCRSDQRLAYYYKNTEEKL